MAGIRGTSTLFEYYPKIQEKIDRLFPGGLKLPERWGPEISKAAYEAPGVVVSYNDPAFFTSGSFLKGLSTAISFLGSPYTAAAKVAVAAAQGEPELIPGQRTTLAPTFTPRSTPMAFQDGDSGFSFDSFFGGVNQALQGGLGQQLLGIGTQALSGFVQQQFAPQPAAFPMGTAGPVAMPTMAAVPAISRGAAVVARGFFNRFPNLATAMQSLRNRGANITRSSLYSALKRFGPEMLVSGGILTAAAVSELAIAGPGRRRMNPGNVKALRRAHRRMKSFHKVCVDNDQLYKRSKRK